MGGRRKKWVVLAAVAVILAAAAVVLLDLLNNSGKPAPNSFAVQRDEYTNEILYCAVQGGLSEEEIENRVLDCYSFTPPEGWTLIQDAAQSANRLSRQYTDVYQNDQGQELTFTQEFATDHLEIKADREVWAGDVQVLYHQYTIAELQPPVTTSEIIWMQGDSLLQISCEQALEVDRMLEWMFLVDYSVLRQPEVSPLNLCRCSNPEEVENWSIDTGWYRTQGNPEIPQPAQFLGFAQPPEGYALSSEHATPWEMDWNYQGEDGAVLNLQCRLGTGLLFNFQQFSHQELLDPAAVTEVTVGGNPGFVHINSQVSEIGWIDGYRTLELSSTAPMTQQELVLLAEQLQPVETE